MKVSKKILSTLALVATTVATLSSVSAQAWDHWHHDWHHDHDGCGTGCGVAIGAGAAAGLGLTTTASGGADQTVNQTEATQYQGGTPITELPNFDAAVKTMYGTATPTADQYKAAAEQITAQ